MAITDDIWAPILVCIIVLFHLIDTRFSFNCILYDAPYRDFYSDLNLSIEILTRDDLLEDILILIAGFGSGFFVLVPYIANLVIASRIKEIIKHNAAAKGWFQYHTPIFTVLVVLSGGCHAALSVVSSNVFGVKLLSCGITQYELKQLGKIRIIGTVLVENIPQLICQGLYTVALARSGQIITTAVQAAFIASTLSIISSSLSFMIERDASDTKAVQYYVSTQCSFRSQKADNNDIDINDDSHGEEQLGFIKQLSTFNKRGEEITDSAANPSAQPSPMKKHGITEEEKQNLLNNRGRTMALGENIAEVFGIPTKNIEVGYSMITRYGIITHVIHYVYDDDLEMMEEELLNEKMDVNRDIIVTPKYFVSQLFAATKTDIRDVFRNHFILNEDFEVGFHHRLGIKRRTLTGNFDAESKAQDQEPALDRRGTLLKRITDQISHGNALEEDGIQSRRERIVEDIKSVWLKHRVFNHEEQDKLMAEAKESMKEELHDEEKEISAMDKRKEFEGDVDINQLLELHDNAAVLEQAIGDTTSMNVGIEMTELNPDISNYL